MTNHIEQVMQTALKNIRGLADVNTVIGKPYTTYDGTTVIPLSKVTVGVLTGGGEYGVKPSAKYGEEYPFSGGGGAAVSLSPVGFLIKNGSDYKMVTVQSGASAYEKLCEAAGILIGKLAEKQ